MAQHRYEYTLTKEDYIQYMRYVASNTKSGGNLRLFIIVSVPVLLAFTCYYFRASITWGHVLGAVVACAYWVFRAAPAIWKMQIDKRINGSLVSRSGISSFSKVDLRLDDREITIDGVSIPYQSVAKVIVLTDVIAVFHGKGAFIVPRRCFADAGAQQDFLTFLDMKTGQAAE